MSQGAQHDLGLAHQTHDTVMDLCDQAQAKGESIIAHGEVLRIEHLQGPVGEAAHSKFVELQEELNKTLHLARTAVGNVKDSTQAISDANDETHHSLISIGVPAV